MIVLALANSVLTPVAGALASPEPPEPEQHGSTSMYLWSPVGSPR